MKSPKRELDPKEIEAAREELRARLPELKRLPGFPKGDDEDILKMSIPPYYTACPNPFIEEWLKETAPEGYDSEPYEDPGPFTADISEGKGHLIYKAHSYPTKVPHQAIMRYILHYTRPGDVVLDAFCGTGMTGVAAQACGDPELVFKHRVEVEMGKVRWGVRRAILQDLSPSATFIAAGLNLPIDAEAFDKRSQEILDEFEDEWGWVYDTTHTDGTKAKIDYTVWSEVFTCPHCAGEVVFYEAAFDEDSGEVSAQFHCPKCGASLNRKSLERRYTEALDALGTTRPTLARRPVAIHYKTKGRAFSRPPSPDDLELLRRIDRTEIPFWFPTEPLPYLYRTKWLRQHGLETGTGITAGHFHLRRSLIALSVLWEKANDSDPGIRLPLLFWIEQAIWGLSLMNRYKHGDHSQVNRAQTGIYYVPALIAECSVAYNLSGSKPEVGKRRNLVKTWARLPDVRAAVISTGSSTNVSLTDSSIDYIFIDPPFGENFYYADLAYLVESWHRVLTPLDAQAIVSKSKTYQKDVAEYRKLMEECFREFFRVLKPGRWMTVEFNNSSNEIWLAIQEALSSAGFVVADTRVFDKQHLSFAQIAGHDTVKRDLIISAYKPADEAEERFSVVAGTEAGAWEFVKEHLSHLPVFEGTGEEARPVRERQGDRLYDRMVAYHIHRGVSIPMTAGEFFVGLEQRLPLRDNMYFLPEQVGDYESKRALVKEFGQADLFITNEASALQWLRQFLRNKPRTFSEIQPPFFTELQEGLPDWEDLPDLKVLLDQNFLHDEKDRWYVPDPKNAADLERVRQKALLKEFEAYISKKGKLEKFRSEAVKAGFKEAWARRDFHMIVQVGNRLPEDVFAEDASLLYYLDNARQRLEV